MGYGKLTCLPLTHLVAPGLTVSPGWEVLTMVQLSRIALGFWKPRNASTSCRSIHMDRSSPHGVKTVWSFWSKIRITSPGSRTGAWSSSPWNVSFWTSFMPLSIWTSRTFFSWTIFLPLQLLHLALGLICSPWHCHSKHNELAEPFQVICDEFLPASQYFSYWGSTHCSFLLPRPSHLSQITFFGRAGFSCWTII